MPQEGGTGSLAHFIGVLDYLLRGAIDILRSYGHEEAAKTLEEYRRKARREVGLKEDE